MRSRRQWEKTTYREEGQTIIKINLVVVTYRIISVQDDYNNEKDTIKYKSNNTIGRFKNLFNIYE